MQNKPCEEPPLEVVPGRADLTHGYSKRRNVFRVTCGPQGAEYLLQCDSSQNMLHWVTTIHKSVTPPLSVFFSTQVKVFENNLPIIVDVHSI